MDKSFNVLHKILQSANARQKVIASNIANADTPGYKAKDVKFGNMVENERRLLTTDPKHISNNTGNGINGNVTVEETPSWGDGNNVEINVEVAKMTENALLHDTAVTILAKKIKMFKAALGRQ
jgi:flagellar basal-body rod protein FlgB